MWKSFNIGKKSWVSLSILILGYFISMVFGFIKGMDTESILHDVSDSIFPASRHGQQALMAFNEQIKLYKDAVLTGEAESDASAQKKADPAKAALKDISVFSGLKDEKKKDVKALLEQLTEFTVTSNKVYSFMISASVNDVTNDSAVGVNLYRAF